MASRLYRVFVYGTLKRGQHNNYLLSEPVLGHAKFVGTGRTVDPWPLVIAGRYNIPFLLYSKGCGKRVLGEVYEVDEAVLKKLDELEAVPIFYTSESALVELEQDAGGGAVAGQEPMQCLTYFLKHFRPWLLELESIENYDSQGPHGLVYVEPGSSRKSRSEFDHIAEVRFLDESA